MIHIEDYVQRSTLCRRTIERKIAAGEIKTIKHNGKTFVINENIIEPAKHVDITNIKEELDRELHLALIGQKDKTEVIKSIGEKVNYYEAALRIKLKGYNYKSLVEKVNGRRPIYRQSRADKGMIRNELVAKNFNKLIELVSYYYFKDAEAKLATAIDFAILYAKEHEEYWEIAGFDKFQSTVYRQVTKHFKESGYPSLHEYMNHYNRWKNNLPRVTGAFTNDIKFGDYIIGDDHKADIAQVWVWDEVKKENVLKQVNIWSWDEPVTMKTWVYLKVGSFTADDLIKSIIPVILEIGLPSKGIVTDNGIANSNRWREFVTKLYEKAGIKGYKYSAAYEPTNKATTELKHAIWKREFDAYQKNYVTPHKEDGRHTGPELSPEKAELFFEDYKRKFESYITGLYLKRKRRRTINGKTIRISIEDYFNELWKVHEPVYPTPQEIRWAISNSTTAVYNNKIKIGKEQFIDVSGELTTSLNGQRFIVLYNPSDLSEVDIYALNDLTDRITGETYSAGSYITTLVNTRENIQHRETVIKLQKEIKKSTRQLSIAITAMQEIEGAMPDQIAANGDIVEQRNQTRKNAEIIINQTISSLPKTAKLNAEETQEQEQEYHLTMEDDE